MDSTKTEWTHFRFLITKTKWRIFPLRTFSLERENRVETSPLNKIFSFGDQAAWPCAATTTNFRGLKASTAEWRFAQGKEKALKCMSNDRAQKLKDRLPITRSPHKNLDRLAATPNLLIESFLSPVKSRSKDVLQTHVQSLRADLKLLNHKVRPLKLQLETVQSLMPN